MRICLLSISLQCACVLGLSGAHGLISFGMKGVGSGFLALLPLGYNKFKSNQPFGVSDVDVKQLLETADICGSLSQVRMFPRSVKCASSHFFSA